MKAKCREFFCTGCGTCLHCFIDIECINDHPVSHREQIKELIELKENSIRINAYEDFLNNGLEYYEKNIFNSGKLFNELIKKTFDAGWDKCIDSIKQSCETPYHLSDEVNQLISNLADARDDIHTKQKDATQNYEKAYQELYHYYKHLESKIDKLQSNIS